MTEIIQINCGTLRVAGYPTVICHCLALRERDEVVLIDSGIGLLDVRDPAGRLGRELIEAAGFQFNERDTAVARLALIGIDPSQVRHIVLTHADPDHAGGLADFPGAQVHLSEAELKSLQSGHPRYIARHFEHGPRWRTNCRTGDATDWFGLPACRIALPLTARVLLVSLPGHTAGHCGVAIEQDRGWFLHVGDAYYLRAELTEPDHPVSHLAAARADDDARRRSSLDHLRRIANEHPAEVGMCGYHDITELPAACIDWEE